MSQEKAQLIAPLGVLAVDGVTATGVITASSFIGNVVGSAKSLVNGANVSVGVITATQFVSNSTALPFYPPVMTTTQRDAMTVTQGAMIFNSTSKKMEFYDGTSWNTLPGMSLGLTVALDG